MKAHANGHSRGTKGTMNSPHQPRAGKVSIVQAPTPANIIGKASKGKPLRIYDSTAGGTA